MVPFQTIAVLFQYHHSQTTGGPIPRYSSPIPKLPFSNNWWSHSETVNIASCSTAGCCSICLSLASHWSQGTTEHASNLQTGFFNTSTSLQDSSLNFGANIATPQPLLLPPLPPQLPPLTTSIIVLLQFPMLPVQVEHIADRCLKHTTSKEIGWDIQHHHIRYREMR